MATNSKELERLVKQKEELSAVIAKQETRLHNLQSTAFSLANYYFVFQGVILTIICNGAQNLKPSDRWFLFTISILAVLFNLVALIKTGIKYIKFKGDLEIFVFRRNKVFGKMLKLSYKDEDDFEKPEGYGESELKLYIYLAVSTILFLGFAAVVLVGCWKFLGN